MESVHSHCLLKECFVLYCGCRGPVVFTCTKYAQCLHIGHHVPVAHCPYLFVLLLLFVSHQPESWILVYVTNCRISFGVTSSILGQHTVM